MAKVVLPFKGTRDEEIEAILAQMRSTLGSAGYIVWFDFLRSFRSRNRGLFAIKRTAYRSGNQHYDRFFQDTAIIVRVVRVRPKGSICFEPYIRIWPLDKREPAALAIIASIIDGNRSLIRVMPCSLNEWRERRDEPRRSWEPIRWFQAVDLSTTESGKLGHATSMHA